MITVFNKLPLLNFSWKSVLWIKSYLTQWFQRTIIVINNIKFKSEWRKIALGASHVFTLGPPLFLLYINDLPSSDTNKLILYADMITAIIKADSENKFKLKLNETIDEISTWFRFKGLILNKEKQH